MAARAQLGRRFFISPSDIPVLWCKLAHFYPHWKQCVMERVRLDEVEGIPLYSGRGPRLGAGFPWATLPNGPGSDDLYAKRPHRFAFAPLHALACQEDPAIARGLRGTLESWIEHAERGLGGACYGGSLRVIQRVLALSWCWAFLAARPPTQGPNGLGLELLVLRVLRADVRYLEPRLGQAVPNNHLLADWFAGWYLQKVFPEFLRRAVEDHERRWSDELLRQTYSDGGSFEHSAHYHEFACEMGVAYLLLCQRHAQEPDVRVKQRVEALLRFQATLTGPSAVALPFGNGVEDTLFPLDPGEGWCSGSLRELYRSLFRPELAAAESNEVSVQRAYWLLAGRLAPTTGAKLQEPGAVDFPESGFHVYNDPSLTARLTFRTGPREGALLTAGHMHADLLCVYLSLDGTPVLVDAGTYTYRRSPVHWQQGTPPWRSYLAGPAAHNTLTIDGEDPLGQLSKDFRPSVTEARVCDRHHIGNGLAWAEGKMIDSGLYTDYTRGCIHVVGCYWLIYDRRPPLDSSGMEMSWYSFQCAPGSRVSVEGSTATVGDADGSSQWALLTSLPGEPMLLEGSINPIGGWVSPRYGEVLPAPQLRYPTARESEVSAFALIPFPTSASPSTIQVNSPDTGGLVFHLTTATCEDLLIIAGGSAAGEMPAFEGLVFEGLLLWVRSEKGGGTQIRWLAADRLEWPALGLNLALDGEQEGCLVIDG
jgi:hypothetical protein